MFLAGRAGRACKGRMGIGLCGVRAISGEGECLVAFRPSPEPILTLPMECLTGTQFSPRSDDNKSDAVPLCGTLLVRELFSRNFLSRTAFADCS